MSDYKILSKQKFKVEIDGTDYGNFTSVTGLGATADVTESLGGMDKNAVNLTGKIKYQPVTITRNSDPTEKTLQDWWATVESGDPEKKPVSIIFYDNDGSTEVKRRNLYECLPTGWNISDLNSTDQGNLTEALTFVYERADWG